MTVMNSDEQCQATKTHGKCVRVKADESPSFVVLPEVARRIRAVALRPREWFNLAAIHAIESSWLASDFYDDRGAARQPKIPVDEGPPWDFPSAAWFRSNPVHLIDLGIVREWDDADDLGLVFAEEFERFGARTMLSALLKVHGETRSGMAKHVALGCGRLLADAERRELWVAVGSKIKDVGERVELMANIGMIDDAVREMNEIPVNEGPMRGLLRSICKYVALPQAYFLAEQYCRRYDKSEWSKIAYWSLLRFIDHSLIDGIESLARASGFPSEWDTLLLACKPEASRVLAWAQSGGSMALLAGKVLAMSLGLLPREIPGVLSDRDLSLTWDLPKRPTIATIVKHARAAGLSEDLASALERV
jgi:hypothetical protein